jgi:hypothetical protein
MSHSRDCGPCASRWRRPHYLVLSIADHKFSSRSTQHDSANPVSSRWPRGRWLLLSVPAKPRTARGLSDIFRPSAGFGRESASNPAYAENPSAATTRKPAELRHSGSIEIPMLKPLGCRIGGKSIVSPCRTPIRSTALSRGGWADALIPEVSDATLAHSSSTWTIDCQT